MAKPGRTTAVAPAARKSVARKSAKKTIDVVEAKRIVLDQIAAGLKVSDATATADRRPETYRDWMKNDPVFRSEVERLRAARAELGDSEKVPVPDFPEFCAELGQPLAPHQQRIWHTIRTGGEKPDDFHAAMRFMAGVRWEKNPGQELSGRLIINMPPGHAKTTTFSINLSVWLIHRNPNIRIIVVCKDQGLAKQILGAVKFKLTSSVYRDLHLKYAPEGGWKDPDASWTQTEIYVQGRGDGEKDPTMQAIGIGGRIYGARSDVIFLDDAITLQNVGEYEKQGLWLEQEVESRLDGAGLLVLFGTRVAPIDLYQQQREVTDHDDQLVYTYFAQPAVLDEVDGKPENWIALWPERFPPARLRRMRRNEATWALVYQQQDVDSDATFNARAVEASVSSVRSPGLLVSDRVGHRQGGMSGLYVVGGLDPATVGKTAMIVSGLDRLTEKRWVLDGFNKRSTTPEQMRSQVKLFTDLYRINEWVIERNAFQRFLTQDKELVEFLRSRGCRLTEHYTTENKYDPDFGIMAMAPLFDSCGIPNPTGGKWQKVTEGDLIELPSRAQYAWVAELVNELVTWAPSGLKFGQLTDLVMALWFTEIAHQRVLMVKRGTERHHLNNPFASRRRLKERTVVNIQDYLAAQREAEGRRAA